MKELKRLFNNYTFIDIYRIIRDKVLTRLFFNSNVRIIRHPFYIVGKKYVRFGKDFQSGPRLRVEVITSKFARQQINNKNSPILIIGDNVSFNFNVHIGVIKKICIGNNTLLGSNISIMDHNHGNYSGDAQSSPLKYPRERNLNASEIYIGDNVWIGDNTIILPGTVIESGCIIGANALVKGKFDKNLIIVGNPASAIKKFNDMTKKWERI